MKSDQDGPSELMKVGESLDPAEREMPERRANIETMAAIDRDNLARFEGVVERMGWPGKSRVGSDRADN